MRRLGATILGLVLGGFAGYVVGNWWLERTVENPELESAVYPMLGMIVGALLGTIVGFLVPSGVSSDGSKERAPDH